MPRKLPALNADNRAFWQGGEQGELLVHRCFVRTELPHGDRWPYDERLTVPYQVQLA